MPNPGPAGLLLPAAMIAAAAASLAAKAWPKSPPRGKPPEWRSEALLTHPPLRRHGEDPDAPSDSP